MRVTQSMLSNTMLRNLNTSYTKMADLQQQISTGSKLLRPSDDPVAVTKAMNYRTQLEKNEQFTDNTAKATSWLDATDDALGQVTSALQRVQELVTQAANDTNNDEDRQAMLKEIDQIRQQIRDVANTQLGEQYLFSGTKTKTPLYTDSSLNSKAGETLQQEDLGGNNEAISYEVFDGVVLDINTSGAQLFSQVDSVLERIQTALLDEDTDTAGSTSGKAIGDMLGELTIVQDAVSAERSTIGAKQNRVDMMKDRLALQKEVLTKAQSDAEDVEYEEAITNLITQESIHNASLSVGGRIIQQTLVDFIR